MKTRNYPSLRGGHRPTKQSHKQFAYKEFVRRLLRFARNDGKILLVLTMMAASLLFNARQAQAQGGVELVNVGATVQYGESITFLAEINASIQIQQASIILLDEAQGLTQVQPLTVTPDGRAEYRFDTRQNLLRPFSTVRWYYEITLADGIAFQSDEYSVRYEDNRFHWQALEAGTVKIHWYNGDANFGTSAMNAAQAGLVSISRILPLDLTQPIDIFLYANESDLQATLTPSGEAWVAGHADPALGVVTTVIAPGAEQTIFMERLIPHELMHVMLYRSVGAGYNNIPAWLSEGTATLAEISPNPDYDRTLTDAGNKNGLIPLKDLCASFSARVDEAFLAYAESRSFTDYLLNTYGSSGLMTLASTYADGVDCERGTERAFGMSLSQLELNWRASLVGQSPLSLTLSDKAPYLVLLCLVLFVPFIAILSTSRKKGDSHG
jgi:hypothetical protein